jgi:NADP-dependent 3-hydroxy acid dehydrogenase YdfG
MSKVILITGASSGLGEAIANYLSEKGYIVYGTSRSITDKGQKFKPLAMDVCSKESIDKAVATILNEHHKIDVVINNAGIGIAGPVEHLDISQVEKVLNTNFFGVIRVCQSVFPSMRKNNSGLVINISSIGSEIGLPYRAGYSASKAAMDRISEGMRMEVKKFGIQICTVQPGGIVTDINKNRILTELPENSAYKESFDRTYKIVNESVSTGLPAAAFGPFIEKIILSKKVKRNYRVGKFTEKLSVQLKRFLPDYVFEKIIMGHYKI